MNNTLSKQIYRFQSSKKANSFFYFLSHNFIFKHFFYDDLPKEYEAKEGIALTQTITSFLFKLTRQVLLIFFICLPLSNTYHPQAFLMYYLIVRLVTMLFLPIFTFNENDYDMVILMKVNPAEYAQYLLRHYLIEQGILKALAMSILPKELGISYLLCLYWVIIDLALAVLLQGVRMILMDRNFRLSRPVRIGRLLVSILLIVFAIVAYFKEIYVSNTVLSIVGILIIGGAVGSWLYLNDYERYTTLFNYNLNELTIAGKNKSISYDGIQYSALNEHLKLNNVKTNRTGFAYLYDLFLQRYRSQTNTSFIIYALISLLIVIVLLILPRSRYLSTFFYLTDISNVIYRFLTLLFFIMYIATSRTTKQFTQLCFFQLDRYLINYNFYRNRQAILENLGLRLKTVLVRNLIIGGIYAIGLSANLLINSTHPEPVKVLITFLLPLVLAFFYSIYNLTAYYLLQPYSFDGTVVNKAYPIVDSLIYFVTYIMLDLEITISLTIFILIAIVLIIISVVLYVLVIRLAPKAFRVK